MATITLFNSHDYDKLVEKILNPVAMEEGMRETTADVRVYFRDQKAFLDQMLSDMQLVLASIVAVFFYMWYASPFSRFAFFALVVFLPLCP